MREFPYILLSENGFNGQSKDTVASNISVINFLRENQVDDNELHPDAFASYCVDFFYTILQNEGLASFVHQTKWDQDLIEIIHSGLVAMQNSEYLDYFEKQQRRIKAFSKIKLAKFLEKPYQSDKEVIALLNDDSFKSFETDLVQSNALWLKAHPDVHVASVEQMQECISEFLQ
ncbi:DMP19 family protein [Myroides sp. LJL116]